MSHLAKKAYLVIDVCELAFPPYESTAVIDCVRLLQRSDADNLVAATRRNRTAHKYGPVRPDPCEDATREPNGMESLEAA